MVGFASGAQTGFGISLRRGERGRLFRILRIWGAALFLVCPLLITSPAFAGQGDEDVAAEAAEPSFLLERITVENIEHVSPDIVTSESLLRAGRTYTENQLRDAVRRIQRLPFILDADFSLRKGSERGRFELVITVYESRRWFFGFDLIRRETNQESIFFDDDETFVGDLLAGRRFYLGKSGELFLAFGGEDDRLTLGYNQYDLFDRSILLSLAYSANTLTSDEKDERWGVNLGVPLQSNQSLRFDASFRRQRNDFTIPDQLGVLRTETLDDEAAEVFLSWVYDSRDDPVFPTQGTFSEIGAGYVDFREEFPNRIAGEPGPETPPRVFERSGATARAGFRRYWSISPRQSFFAGVSGTVGNLEAEHPLNPDQDSEDSWSTALSVGHSIFLKRIRRPEAWRELRWENEVTYSSDQREFIFLPEPDIRRRYVIGTGLAYRNGWGVFRVRLEFADIDSEDLL